MTSDNRPEEQPLTAKEALAQDPLQRTNDYLYDQLILHHEEKDPATHVIRYARYLWMSGDYHTPEAFVQDLMEAQRQTIEYYQEVINQIHPKSPYVVHYATPRGSDAIQRLNNLLLRHGPMAVVIDRREITVTWWKEEDEKRFQAAWKASLEPVKLYEDNIGNLYLHQQGSSLVYQVLLPSRNSSFFKDDCQDIAQGNTQDWKEELVHGYAEMQDTLRPPWAEHIATWYPNKLYELHQQPGEAGRRYLQSPTEE